LRMSICWFCHGRGTLKLRCTRHPLRPIECLLRKFTATNECPTFPATTRRVDPRSSQPWRSTSGKSGGRLRGARSPTSCARSLIASRSATSSSTIRLLSNVLVIGRTARTALLIKPTRVRSSCAHAQDGLSSEFWGARLLLLLEGSTSSLSSRPLVWLQPDEGPFRFGSKRLSQSPICRDYEGAARIVHALIVDCKKIAFGGGRKSPKCICTPKEVEWLCKSRLARRISGR